MKFGATPEVVEKTIELGKLVLAFGRTLRVTHHEDGERRETDTDHTVMLGLLACAYADSTVSHLDLGMIAEYALIHDLVEVYAGDTNAYGKVNDDHVADKQEREAQALVRIRAEFDCLFPWIGETMERYESLEDAEARFVKVVDKVLPKAVHVINRGATVRELGGNGTLTHEFHQHQFKKLSESYGSDQPEALELLQSINTYIEENAAALEVGDEMEAPSSPILASTIDLCKFVLAFGRIERHTCHEDGVRQETDTDHTVMLGIIACAFAEQFEPTLDRGLIAQFALVHDLVEVYAGDTYSGKILQEESAANKVEREHAALVRIKNEFDSVFPWIGKMIEKYESLDTPEARYIKVLDKALPKITNILNGGVTIKRAGHTAESLREFIDHQHEKVSGGYGADQEGACEMLRMLGNRMHEEIFG